MEHRARRPSRHQALRAPPRPPPTPQTRTPRATQNSSTTRPPPPPQKPDPAPDPKRAETPPPPPEESAKPEPAPKPPPVPKKAATQPKADAEPKKEEFDINKVMALLDKRDVAHKSAPNARVADKTVKGFGPQTAMTMDLQDALRSQIQECWNPPVGAPHPEELVVEFELHLKSDGSVAEPPQLSAQSASVAAHDSFTRAAAEAARRAIYTCQPYKLPADRYAQWQEITLNFDPRQMVGQ